MEQLRLVIDWLKVHHFWVLLVLVLGLMAGTWFTATSSLATTVDSNKKKIESEFSKVQQINGKPFKPNQEIIDGQAVEVKQQAANTLEIWKMLYARQTASALKWPVALKPAFRSHVENKKFGDSILKDMREEYRNYIDSSFKSLVEIVDAEMLEIGTTGRRSGSRGFSETDFGGPGGEAGAAEEESAYMVDWIDQASLRTRLTFDNVPSALEIWVTQEDLWVYETLLRAIADTNKATGARRRDRAAVRTIRELQVGRAAAGASASEGRLFVPAEKAVSNPGYGGEFGGDFMEGGGYMEGGFSEGGYMEGGGFSEGGYMEGGGYSGGGYMDGGGFAEGGGGGTDEASILLGGRYLGDDGKPIMTVTEGDYSFSGEFKRLPVKMTLEMNEAWLNTLIANLANAPLQVEVEQVRINPQGAASSRRSSAIGGANQGEAFDQDPQLATIILQGNVYIFNEPNEARLTVDEL